MRKYFNRSGELLTEKNWFLPKDEKYFDEHGEPLWDKWIMFGDQDGFDTRHKTASGTYIERIVLPKGKIISRYGPEHGTYTTDQGGRYDDLSLPYVMTSVPYHEYIVMEECEVDCVVDRGVAAPGFDSAGGGVQYKHCASIHDLVFQDVLKEDYSWLRQEL